MHVGAASSKSVAAPPADGTPAHEAGPTPREPDPDRLSRTQPDRPSRRTPLSIHGRGVGPGFCFGRTPPPPQLLDLDPG